MNSIKPKSRMPQRPNPRPKTINHQERDDPQIHSVFVDAALCDDSLVYATGFAIFNPRRNLTATGCRKIQPPGTILAAELQAIADGITYGLCNFPGPLRILSDSLEAVHAIHSGAIYKGPEEMQVQGVKKLLADSSVKGV